VRRRRLETSLATEPDQRQPLVLGVRPGRLRRRDNALPGLLIAAMALLLGYWAVLPALLLLPWPGRSNKTHGVLVVTPAECDDALWIDRSRVVLRAPWRVVYSDELTAPDYCRLRRLCLGLPE